MHPGITALVGIGDKLLASRPLFLWQILAENFHPMRADITNYRTPEEEINFAMSSVPILVRRELADGLKVNLRPKHAQWFKATTDDEDIEFDADAQGWLEYASKVMRRAIYDPKSGFVKTTSEADSDWVTFGQAVIHIGLNDVRDSLLFQNFHIKDCGWSEGTNGIIDTMHRNWSPTVRQIVKLFPKTKTEKHTNLLKEDPEKGVKCRHIVLPADNGIYDSSKAKAGRDEFISIIVDMENDVVLEELGQKTFRYVVPRWATCSNTPWARSPVCEVLLPDARSLQALTRIILESGEKAVDPATILSQEVFRSDLDLRAGGITWADLEYDQRLADKFAVLSPQGQGLPVALQLSQMLTGALRDGSYVSKLSMPDPDRERVTAYEIRKALEKRMAEVSPIYEPAEEVYSSPMLDETMSIMLEQNAFGRTEDIPQALRGADVNFTFSNPLREAEKELDAHRFVQGAQMVQMATPLSPAAAKMIKTLPALKKALLGIGWSHDDLASDDEIMAAEIEGQQKQQMMEQLAAAQQGGDAAKSIGEAGKNVGDAAQSLEGVDLSGLIGGQ